MGPETDENWEARALERTGCDVAAMRRVSIGEGDHLPGPIFCRRGDEYICATGYPIVDDDGVEVWAPDDFVLVRV